MPKKSDAGREAVCILSLGGEGEKGRKGLDVLSGLTVELEILSGVDGTDIAGGIWGTKGIGK